MMSTSFAWPNDYQYCYLSPLLFAVDGLKLQQNPLSIDALKSPYLRGIQSHIGLVQWLKYAM